MTGFEPGPPELKPFKISDAPDDLFCNCMQFIDRTNSVQGLYSMDDSPEMMKGYRKC